MTKTEHFVQQSLNRSALGNSTYGTSSGGASGLGVDSIEAQRRMMECDEVIKVGSAGFLYVAAILICDGCLCRD